MTNPLKLEWLLLGAILFYRTAPAQAAVLRPVWRPNGPVEALLLRGSTLYIGGSFSNLISPNGLSIVARSNLAALDWASGTPLAWDPKTDGPVYALATQGTAIYAGGQFSWAGSLTLSALAALDLTSNIAQAWDPHVSGTVRCLASNGSSLFLGGDFVQVGGIARLSLAEVNLSTPTATTFDAQLGASSTVRTLTVAGNLLYVGGSFSNVLGTPRSSLAALSKTGGALSTWAPTWTLAANPWVHSLFALNGALWVAGDFSGSSNGIPVLRLAAFNLTTAQALWLPNGPDASAHVIIADGSGRVHTGGIFSSAGGQARSRYASYFQSVALLETAYSADLNTGASDLRAMCVNGTELALGGQFTQVDSQGATNLAILSLPALGPVPSPTPILLVGSTLVPGTRAFIYPQPGFCGSLKVALPFSAPGSASLRVRSVRGTLLRTQELDAVQSGVQRVLLDCAGLEPGLYWLEIDRHVLGAAAESLAPLRFILLEPK